MNSTTDLASKTALVTGANSGLGLEAAAQLAEDGWGRVILACRTLGKANAARTKLVKRVGSDPFQILGIDTSEVGSADSAVADLRALGGTIDFLLLNAGASSKEPSYNADRVETTYASTLIGHHVLTMGALEHHLLCPDARIVIAGSEGARGNLPGMKVHDIAKIADEQFDGDRSAAISALARISLDEQKPFDNMNECVTAKTVVAWWAAALSRRLPNGMTVNAVSPGSNAGTSFARDMSRPMKLMVGAMKTFGSLLGINMSVDKGARRYLDAADFGTDDTGHFFASEHKRKAVGPMAVQTWPDYFTDEESQEAALDAIVHLTGVEAPRPRADEASRQRDAT